MNCWCRPDSTGEAWQLDILWSFACRTNGLDYYDEIYCTKKGFQSLLKQYPWLAISFVLDLWFESSQLYIRKQEKPGNISEILKSQMHAFIWPFNISEITSRRQKPWFLSSLVIQTKIIAIPTALSTKQIQVSAIEATGQSKDGNIQIKVVYTSLKSFRVQKSVFYGCDTMFYLTALIM